MLTSKKTLFRIIILSILPILIGAWVPSLDNPKKSMQTQNTTPLASFEVTSMKITKDEFLNWTTEYENGSLPYIIEQYIFNQWVSIGKVKGIGSPSANSYSFKVNFHNGENQFRIKQRGGNHKSKYSEIITVQSQKSSVGYELDNNRAIHFSRETFYLIYSPYGDIIEKGCANSISISHFKKGRYCLIYDNKLGEFSKKRNLLVKTPTN